MTSETEARLAIAAPRQASMTTLLHFYISPAHNFFGHHGLPAGTNPMIEVPSMECVAGRGIRGDRFFDYKENYKGQITFMAVEVYEFLCQELNIFDVLPSVFRRNVITYGIELNALIGKEFVLEGVWFRGTEECKPCYWMDQAFAPGVEALMRGRGGLRAVILTSGRLQRRFRGQFAASQVCRIP